MKEATNWVEKKYNVKFNASQNIPEELGKVFDNYVADKFQGKKWDLEKNSSVY